MKLVERFRPVQLKAPVAAAMPAKFTASLDSFLITGHRLCSYTKAGLNHDQFEAEYLATYAALDMVLQDWSGKEFEDALTEFNRAIQGWKLARKLWGPPYHGKSDLDRDSRLLASMDRYAPGRVFRFPDDANSVPVEHNLRIMLAVAAEHFTEGQRLLRAPEAKRTTR